MTNIQSTEHLCLECRACEQICPKDAIFMQENTEGFSYPHVDAAKCIDCGLCLKVCPAMHADDVKNESGLVYAAQLQDKKVLAKSSSGGIFSLIAEHVIASGGVVFGAAWDDNLQLHHIGVDSLDLLQKLRGSKYVHSDIGDTFVQVRNYLKSGKMVYYTGTPCQIAGLRLFLRKDYPNLITSDLICHGTPSQKIFNLFTERMEKEQNIKLTDYQFRDKKVFGWSCSSSSSSSINNVTGKKKYHFYDRNMVGYFQAFIKGHITREDCYQCPFACPERVSDITLADYWDISDFHPAFPNRREGVSLIIVNTSRGQKIFDSLKTKVILCESSLKNALATSNHNLKAPTPRPLERDNAYKEAFSDFERFRNKYAAMAHSEEYYNKVYRNKKIKSLPLIHSLLKMLGKV